MLTQALAPALHVAEGGPRGRRYRGDAEEGDVAGSIYKLVTLFFVCLGWMEWGLRPEK